MLTTVSGCWVRWWAELQTCWPRCQRHSLLYTSPGRVCNSRYSVHLPCYFLRKVSSAMTWEKRRHLQWWSTLLHESVIAREREFFGEANGTIFNDLLQIGLVPHLSIRCRTVGPYINPGELVVSMHHCHKHYPMVPFGVEEKRTSILWTNDSYMLVIQCTKRVVNLPSGPKLISYLPPLFSLSGTENDFLWEFCNDGFTDITNNERDGVLGHSEMIHQGMVTGSWC